MSEAAVTESVEEVVAEVKDRLGEQPPALMTGDESATYATVIAPTFSGKTLAEWGRLGR